MRRLQLRDVIKLGNARKTDEGFIEADAVFSRVGCQDYTRRELDLDGDPNEIVTLYRPADEVGSPESVRSLDGKPLTLNHPPEDVNADNWKRYAIGDAQGVKFSASEGVTKGRATIRDAAGVLAYESGTRELSVGYSFDLDMTPGTAPDGKKYHGVQRNIRGNHHAVLDEGRCGGQCRVGDANNRAADCRCNRTGDRPMTMRKIKTDDMKLVDAKGAPILSVLGLDVDFDVSTSDGQKAFDAVDRHARGLKDCMDAYKSKDAEVSIHKERADAAEKRLAQLDAMPDDDDEDEEGEDDKKDGDKKAGDRTIAYLGRLKTRAAAAKDEKSKAERQRIVDAALKVLGADWKADGKDVVAVRRAVVAKALEAKDSTVAAIVGGILGGSDANKAPVEKVTAAFDAVIAAHAREEGGRRVGDAELEVGRAFASQGSSELPADGGGAGGARGNDAAGPRLVGHDHLMARLFGGGTAS